MEVIIQVTCAAWLCGARAPGQGRRVRGKDAVSGVTCVDPPMADVSTLAAGSFRLSSCCCAGLPRRAAPEDARDLFGSVLAPAKDGQRQVHHHHAHRQVSWLCRTEQRRRAGEHPAVRDLLQASQADHRGKCGETCRCRGVLVSPVRNTTLGTCSSRPCLAPILVLLPPHRRAPRCPFPTSLPCKSPSSTSPSTATRRTLPTSTRSSASPSSASRRRTTTSSTSLVRRAGRVVFGPGAWF